MQIKEVVLAGVDASLETALMLERKANQLLFATRDQKEGMQAFIEKRKPKFEGGGLKSEVQHLYSTKV
ncbi:enoyl-CoA hydratase/carnithine racemase [Polaromonas sp. CG_9.5]|uniref:enoyl-CoA hydratase-related protein n=1 Tax=Polaromonas sp. CG_9.5 TaxID=3071705 RepID=UPI002E0AD28C|nr:enoyl-CoA hydratase/carnithine racemase [Polaromonas sp. CG_9.5]